MPEIKPFRALLFNKEKTRLDRVVAPPYDVIAPAHQAKLYDADEHNIIRLILNRDQDRYASSKEIFERWRADQILVADDSRSMYVLSQRYKDADGKDVVRSGFIAACRLEEIGKGSVMPHEKTLSKPKEDRLKLLHAMGTMFSQIFSVYSDPGHDLDIILTDTMKAAPSFRTVHDGVENNVWVLRDAFAMGEMAEFMHEQKVLIADGHHRYETALTYASERKNASTKHTGHEAYNYVPMFFTNMYGEGLIIHPTHRLIHSLPSFNPVAMVEAIGKYFTVEPAESLVELKKKLSARSSGAFGLVLPGNSFKLLTLKNMKDVYGGQTPTVLEQLDVTILHSLILKNILNITEEQQEKKLHLDYEKDAAVAADAVASGKAQAAILMNPTRVEDVRAVAESGKVMPQKSTYFFPKLLSGLVNYSFIDSL